MSALAKHSTAATTLARKLLSYMCGSRCEMYCAHPQAKSDQDSDLRATRARGLVAAATVCVMQLPGRQEGGCHNEGCLSWCNQHALLMGFSQRVHDACCQAMHAKQHMLPSNQA